VVKPGVVANRQQTAQAAQENKSVPVHNFGVHLEKLKNPSEMQSRQSDSINIWHIQNYK
jgi:hypothetical protein